MTPSFSRSRLNRTSERLSFLRALCLAGILSFPSLTQAGSVYPFPTEPVALTLNGARLDDLRLGGIALGRGGEVTFRNGRDGSLLETVAADGGQAIRFPALEKVSATLEAKEMPGGYTALTLVVANHNAGEIWLESEVALPFLADRIQYYNGFEPSDKPGEREGIGGIIPFASLYEEGGRGLALGINPLQIRSYLANAASWEGKDGTLRYRTRLVIPPGGQEEVDWVVFAYQARHGHLDAIHCYQQFFPSRARLDAAAHPNLRGAAYGQAFWRAFHEQYSRKESMTANRGELYRRFGGGWEWGYGGYGYRPGDWKATEELTGDWRMKLHPKQATFREDKGYSAADHLQRHLDAFQRAEPFNITPLLYLIPTYCEEDLAESLYKDSIYYDDQGRPRPAGAPWVHSYDRCYQMYCYGNSFGDYTFAVLPEILQRANVWGIAFDCMDRSGYNYFGPGVERSPGTAYDPERGRYANMDTAAALFTRRVHEIEKDRVRMSVVGNIRAQSTSYLAAGEMDAAIVERPPWDQNPRPDLLRLMMGQKPITFWHGYQKLPKLPENRDELIKLVEGLSDYSLHRSFELGIYMNLKVLGGFPKLFYYQRYAREFFGDLGWQPVQALKPGHKQILVARYGDDTGAAFFLGNTTPADIETTAELERDYFGGGDLLIGDAEGEIAIPNQVADQRYGPVRVVSREPRLLRVYATLPGGVIQQGMVNAQLTKGGRSRLIVTGEVKAGGVHPVEFFIPPGYRMGGLSVDGKKVGTAAVSGRSHVQTATVSLVKGAFRLELEWLPETEIREPGEVVKFPYLDGKEAGFAIRAERPEVAKLAGEKLSCFFGAAVNGIGPGAEVVPIPTAEAGRADSAPKLLIGSRAFLMAEGVALPEGSADRSFISRIGNNLVIATADRGESDVASAVGELLDLLAPEYPVYGYVSISKETIPWTATYSPTYFTEKTGLTSLPWKKRNPSEK